eukprot:CAMPEP_0181322770 /NCGR_PEP_ID=MMETSP1101-20121128/19408_1 /TAXON_ID=46948 /ORGANISM="Rhodomonas abbreviata, Strain Caron Lab Isolate" /LENGTH=61 /DNA_ID=CAMNT_0023430711 /DNA_START=73 /DNA_END=255 /DNA_ORIENTATION=+
MEAGPPPGRGGGEDPPGKGQGQGGGRRNRQQESLDVFGGTEGQAVIFIAVLFYVIQQLTTW